MNNKNKKDNLFKTALLKPNYEKKIKAKDLPWYDLKKVRGKYCL